MKNNTRQNHSINNSIGKAINSLNLNLAGIVKPAPVKPRPKGCWFGYKDQTVTALCLTHRGTIVAVGSLLAYIKPRFFGTGTMLGLPASVIFGQEAVTEPWAIETPKGAGYPDRKVNEDQNCTISALIEEYGLDLELITINQIAVSRCLVASRTTMDPKDWTYDVTEFAPCTGVGLDPEWIKQLGFPAMDYAMWQFRSTFSQVLGIVEQSCGLQNLTEAPNAPAAEAEAVIEAQAEEVETEAPAAPEVTPVAKKKRLTPAAPRAKKEPTAKKPKAIKAKTPAQVLGLNHPETPEAVNEFQASLDRCLAVAQ
jgi:hypothetical protein